MFNFLFKKEHQVESLIYDYLDTLKKTHENFASAIDTCVEKTVCEAFDFYMEQTHKYESKADDIREEINNLMYGKVLIPDSREDVMNLLASLDQIPYLLERVLYIIQTQRVSIPPFMLQDFRDLVRISLLCFELVIRQVHLLFKKETGIRELVSTIDTHESHCDHIERRLITRLFESDLDPFDKLQIKELVVTTGDISDKADSVSRRINIMNMKRRV